MVSMREQEPATQGDPDLPAPAPAPPSGYLDAVGGQPLLPVAQRAWSAAADQSWADPARLHHRGRRAGMVLDAARASVATSLGVRPEEVYFTACGPVSIGAAVAGMAEGRSRVSGRIVASAVESMALMTAVEAASTELELVPVGRTGRIDLEQWQRALELPTALACLQAANAEVGTRQPIQLAARAAHDLGIPVLVDATQVVGRDDIPPDWDLLTASARDWGGPAGVGVLAVRASARWIPDQTPDRGWVGGFPDIPAAAAAATALEYLGPVAAQESERLRTLVDRLRHELPAAVEGLEVAGDPDDRLPHILTFTCTDITGEILVTELDRRGVAVASGSACTADNRMPSHVLAAMGISSDASVRVSLPIGCTTATVDLLLAELPGAVATVRARFEP